ncbi:hypothetical protein CE91St43_25210 [Oscillospiraceae bacterium]|nr:hypothetical protein CE91St43_25210 [Oscillospiraceae bacterium]
MKRETSKWAAPLLGVLALLAWGLCAFLAQEIGALSSGVSARWEGEGGVSPAQVEEALRYAREDGGENVPRMTLWREKPGAVLWDEGEERTAAASVVEFYGQGADLWPVPFLTGNYPAQGDAEGIAVDEALSAALWGGVGRPGQIVRWEGKTYVLRGVFRGDGGLALLPGRADDADAWPNLFLRFPQQGGREAAQAFLNRNGWSGGDLLDLELLSWCVTALAGLPGAALLLGLLWKLLRRGLALRASPLLLASYLPPALCAGALALWCGNFPPRVPAALIPTKWSDFSFWARLASGLGESLGAWLSGPLTLRDLRLWPLALGCLLLSAAALALTLLAAERVRPRDGQGVVAGWALSLGTLLALVFLLGDRGGLALSRPMLLLPVLWPLFGWGLARHEEFLRPRERGEEHEALEAPGDGE